MSIGIKRVPVTVVVPVKNEEKNLEACLHGLQHFHEMVVVDSNSTDSTVSIAEKFGAKVLNFEWNGKFPKKRNWVLRNYKFSTQWVLFIDADEIVDSSFVSELAEAIKKDEFDGFWLNYSNYFMGKKLNYGVSQRKLACFKIGVGEYERIEEESWSSLDMEIHEHPILDGKIGEIRSPIDHRDFRGIARFLERHIDYAKWECNRFELLRGERGHDNKSLTSRQAFKYRNIDKWWFATFYFIYTYFLRLGFLDGAAGLQYARYKRWYFQTVRNLIFETEA